MSETYHYFIEGMHCPSCVRRVEQAAKSVGGVKNPAADYVKGTLSFSCTGTFDEELLRAAVDQAGYTLKNSRSFSWIIPPGAVSALMIIAAVLTLYCFANHFGLTVFLNFFPQAEEDAGYAALFVVGLLTSVHCVAMCGGINLSQSALAAKSGSSVLRANLDYQLGRLLSYFLIGGLVGLLGRALSMNQYVKGGITIFAGFFMAVMAVNMLGGFAFLRRLQPRMPKPLAAKLGKSAQGRGSFYIGLANGLMPCGPLQSMQLYALASGGFLAGALSMFIFCAGTIPLLFLFGLLSGKLNRKFSAVMMKVSAAVVLLLSISMLQNGLALTGMNLGNAVQNGSAASSGSISANQNSAAADPGSVSAGSGSTTAAVSDDGKQYVTSHADYNSYDPITVYEGIPVVWTLIVPEGKLIGCNNEILVSEYGLDVKLQDGENVIEFTPEETGTYAFSCWMGMIRSTITVESPSAD